MKTCSYSVNDGNNAFPSRCRTSIISEMPFTISLTNIDHITDHSDSKEHFDATIEKQNDEENCSVLLKKMMALDFLSSEKHRSS
jgi:hypothetical protein